MQLKDAIIEYLDYLPAEQYTPAMVPVFNLCEHAIDQDNVQSIVTEEMAAMAGETDDEEDDALPPLPE